MNTISALLLAGCLGLVACGSPDPKTPAAPPPPATGPAPMAPPPASPPRASAPPAPILRPAPLTPQQTGNEQALQQILSRTAKLHTREFRNCYDDALKGDPTLKGTIVIETTVAPSGDPVTVKDHGSTMPSRQAIECVKAVFTRIEYAPWQGVASTIVVPFAFDREVTAEPPTE